MAAETHLGLHHLKERIARDVEAVAYPSKPWLDDAPGILDCAIVGGGQYGLALSFALRREKVASVVFDQNKQGYEGPWATFAQMQMLRTPKDLTGPDLGIPSLGFRAWYEAQHGAAAWQTVDRIGRLDWMDYLRWYREVLQIDLRNEMRLIDLHPRDDGLFSLDFSGPQGTRTIIARTVVLATGAEGSGDRIVPSFIADALPRHLFAHTNDAPDPAAMRGKRIGILGAGASAFDYAAASLENGATSAALFFRRAALPLQNPRRWMENAGFLAHYPELPDAQRWAYMQRLAAISQPPPAPTFERAAAQPGFSLHPATPWTKVEAQDDGTILIQTPRGPFTVDFVMAATGMVVDLSLRPELAALAPLIATWGDRYAPPDDLTDKQLSKYPYLGRFCEFQEKRPGEAPWLSRVFTITRGATLSMGPVAASNSAMKYTLPRLVGGVTRALFLDGANGRLDTFLSTRFDELDATRVRAVRP